MGGVERNYYLAAEKVLWDYAPSGKDLINNVSLTEPDRWAKTLINIEWHTAASSLMNANRKGHYLAQHNTELY